MWKRFFNRANDLSYKTFWSFILNEIFADIIFLLIYMHALLMNAATHTTYVGRLAYDNAYQAVHALGKSW